ncbi:KAP family P-loop NTPase fold protein [Paenibacillus peoriae]|uniref:KAP family P-loop NTPase fold protein n=1 Tax=Paenibacillus peoriae TaxID=59893 RepID=UPI00096BFD95|nr:P-loop NTPase fold protein [Paenibacillus peoriae]OMF34759.1 hypothetical protein BK134_05750 [Paenibacillus peoriae]
MNINHLPLESVDQDLLNFSLKSKEIAEHINNYSNHIPYAISINGTWGAGKSTMLNFIESNINKDKCAVIRFNPWIILEKEEILFSLFEEIYDCIDNGFTSARKKFLNYAQKLTKPVSKMATYFTQTMNGVPHQAALAVSDSASEAVSQITNTFFEKPISKRKKEIEKELQQMFVQNNKKIVIFIDEIDRMFPEEVIRIFQVIKSVLDLPGLLFVVAMDKESIEDSLTKAGIQKPNDYLQKIFQLSIPIISRYQLRTLSYNLFLCNVDKTPYKEQLKYLFDTFIDLKKQNFLIPVHQEKHGMYSGETIESRTESIYNRVYNNLRRNYENPRKFIKLANYIMVNWDAYLSEMENSGALNELDLQTAFLLFLGNYEYHPEIHEIMVTEYKEESLMASIKSFINLHYPNNARIQAGKSYILPAYDDILDKSSRALNKYPDALRYMNQLKEKGELDLEFS